MSTRKQPPKSLRADARRLLAECPAWTLRLAARRLADLVEARLTPTGLSFAQAGLMAEVAAAEDDSIGALAGRMGLDQSTLSRTLRTLESAGLVEIAAVEGDLRRRMVWLTETGARRLEAALAEWRPVQRALAKRLPANLLRRIASAS